MMTVRLTLTLLEVNPRFEETTSPPFVQVEKVRPCNYRESRANRSSFSLFRNLDNLRNYLTGKDCSAKGGKSVVSLTQQLGSFAWGGSLLAKRVR